MLRYLFPRSLVDQGSWSSYGAGDSLWQRVNDAAADAAAAAAPATPNDDTDGITTTTDQDDCFLGLAGDLITGDLITSVTLRARLKHDVPAGCDFFLLVANALGATFANGAITVGIADTWTDIENSWATSPFTGLAWTPAEVNALRVGLYPSTGAFSQAWLTSLEAEIDYTPAEPTGDFSRSIYDMTLSVDADITLGTGDSVASYAWNWGDGTPAGSGDTASHTYAADGDYTVTLTVTTAAGHELVIPHTVTIDSIADDWAGTFTATVMRRDVYFHAEDITPPPGNVIESYTWDFGDATGDTGVAPLHRFPAYGSYTVILLITLVGGGTTTLTKEVTLTMARPIGLTADTPDSLILDAGALYAYYGVEGSERLLGATRGGARFSLNREFREPEVDGARGPIKGLTREVRIRPTITVQLLELTLANLLAMIPGATSTLNGDTYTITSGEIGDSDYFTNIALAAAISGSDEWAVFVVKNALIMSSFDIQTQDANEASPEIMVVGHIDPATPNTPPYEILYPNLAGSGS